MNKYLTFLQSGAVYISGRLDKAGLQPIIVIDVKKFIDMDMDIPELEDNLKFIFNWVVEQLFSLGRVEQFFVIVDLEGVGVLDIPIKKLKPFVAILSHSFKGQMYRSVSCGTSSLMRGIFNIVSLWLSEFEQESMILCPPGECKDELLKYMSLDKIEERFGGTKPNVSKYFPPVF